MKKILFIVNPLSGTDRIKTLTKDIEQHLNLNIFSYKIIYTQYAKHATKLATEAAENKFDIVVAVGGDGSVNDVIHGIYGTDVIMGIIPKGSGNGLARSLKIPLKESKAIQLINKLNVQEIDIGQANENLFASNAGVGFDTLVTSDFKNNTRRGLLSYLQIIIKNIWTYQTKKWNYKIDGKPQQSNSFMLTIANAAQLGYGFQIAPQADLTDGYFNLVNIKKIPVLWTPLLALKAFTGKINKSRFVSTQKIKEISIQHPDLNLLQVDGESLVCQQKVHIKMMPKKLKILTA